MAHSILRSFLRFPSCSICSFTKPAYAYSRWYHYNNCRSYGNFRFVQKANNKGFSNRVNVAFSMNYNSSSATSTCETADGREYLAMTDEKLMSQCEMDTFKASGPGGQHRNKRETAVRLKHLPTGIIAQASEDRSQHKNRAAALSRLRTLLAMKGTLLILIPMYLLRSLFKFFLQSQLSEDRTEGLRLVQIILNLLWECRLCLT